MLGVATPSSVNPATSLPLIETFKCPLLVLIVSSKQYQVLGGDADAAGIAGADSGDVC